MESLRWILLVVGIIFVLVIYFLGRNRRRQNNSISEDQYDDLPEFSARNLDDFDEGVGEVRVVGNTQSDYDDGYASSPDQYDHQQYDSQQEDYSNDETSNKSDDEANRTPSDIIVLYILAKPGKELLGSHINSSVQAMGLSFGDMDIFHYRPGHRNIFSIANMMEPGSFDANTIHDIRTSGLTVFMQISGTDPLDDLTEMLQRSYQLAGLLDARLCNNRREPLTEQDAENYRAQVRTVTGN